LLLEREDTTRAGVSQEYSIEFATKNNAVIKMDGTQ
jgi:hypothetical protein